MASLKFVLFVAYVVIVVGVVIVICDDNAVVDIFLKMVLLWLPLLFSLLLLFLTLLIF